MGGDSNESDGIAAAVGELRLVRNLSIDNRVSGWHPAPLMGCLLGTVAGQAVCC